jgi:hypothetical protein
MLNVTCGASEVIIIKHDLHNLEGWFHGRMVLHVRSGICCSIGEREGKNGRA